MPADKRELDDDLIVEVEDLVDTGLPEPEEEIEDEEPRTPEAPTTPDAEGNDWIGDDEPEDEPETDDRVNDAAPDHTSEFEREARVAEFLRAQNAERAELMWQRTEAWAAKYANDRAQADFALNYTNQQIEAAYRQLAYADEAGDSNAKVEAQKALDDLRTFRTQLETVKTQIPDPDRVRQQGYQEAIRVRDQAIEPGGVQVGANLRAKNPLAADWAKSNASWMKTNAKANEFIIRASDEMVKSGQWSPNERGFYAELSRRVKAQFPSLKVAAPSAPKGNAAQRRSAPVAASRPSAGTPSAQQRRGSPTRIKLDATLQAKMRNMNLDPKNKEHAKAYAEVLIRRRQSESARGAR